MPGVTATRVAAGSFHTCAVTTAGGVKCWGANAEDQLGDGSNSVQSVTPVDVVGLTTGATAVCAGWRHSCAVTTAGGVKCWGRNVEGQLGNGNTMATTTPVDVFGLNSGVQDVSCGQAHSCALKTNGQLWCWGENGSSRLGDGTSTDRFTPVLVSAP